MDFVGRGIWALMPALIVSTWTCSSAFSAEQTLTPLFRARAAATEGDYSQALTLYKECLGLPQFRDPAVVETTRILVRQNRSDQAIELLQDFLKNQNAFNHEARLALAELYQRKGQLPEALKQVEAIEKIRPDYMMAQERKGRILFDLEKYKDSIDSLSKMIAVNPSAHGARLVRAHAYLKNGQKAQAMSDLSFLQINDPNALGPALMLADLQIEEKKLKEADATIRAAIKRAGTSVGALERLADIQIKQGQPRAAKDLLAEAASLDPNAADLGVKLGKLYVEIGEPERAIAEFQRVLKANPDSDPAQFNLIKAYESQGRLDLLGTTLKSWVDRFPEKTWSSVAYARSLSAVGQFDVAEAALKKNLVKANYPVESMLALADVKKRSGVNKETMKAFADAEKRYPAEPEVKFAFANFLKEIGATDRALSKLNQIQDKNPEIQKRVQELSNQIKVTQQNEKPKSG